ncbi:MAG TPA: CAP domain-containing protein [Sphingomonas sp.]|nr:CAP domain-containing protein [Sphingomonas sp.]
MHIGTGMLVAAALAAPAIAYSHAPIDDRRLLAELNAARTDPPAFVRGLTQYRSYFHAGLLRYPDLDADIATEEGVAVVDETITFLGHQPPLGQVSPSALLQAAAAAHVADQARTGEEGHAGSDGSTPGQRVKRLGGGSYVAEIISYGSIDALDAIRQLIVDDGVADRGHRSIVYSGELRYAGAACGPHPRYRTICVIDLAVSPDGRYPGDSARYASRQAAR